MWYQEHGESNWIITFKIIKNNIKYFINVIENDDEEDYLIDLSIKFTINVYFNAFDFDNKWFFDFRVSSHVTRNKYLLSKIKEPNIFNIRITKI